MENKCLAMWRRDSGNFTAPAGSYCTINPSPNELFSMATFIGETSFFGPYFAGIPHLHHLGLYIGGHSDTPFFWYQATPSKYPSIASWSSYASPPSLTYRCPGMDPVDPGNGSTGFFENADVQTKKKQRWTASGNSLKNATKEPLCDCPDQVLGVASMLKDVEGNRKCQLVLSRGGISGVEITLGSGRFLTLPNILGATMSEKHLADICAVALYPPCSL